MSRQFCFYLDTDNTYYRFAVKYFDPQDIILSVFFYLKKFSLKGDMWALQYTAIHLREFTALMLHQRNYMRAKREKINKRLIPIAEVKPMKRMRETESENNPPEVVDLASEDDMPLINFRDSRE